AAFWRRRECPKLIEALERRLLGGDLDPSRIIEHRSRRKAGAQSFETHDLIHVQDIAFPTADANRDEPFDEFRVLLHIGDKIEEPARAIGKLAAFTMARHRRPA